MLERFSLGYVQTGAVNESSHVNPAPAFLTAHSVVVVNSIRNVSWFHFALWLC